MTVRTYNYPAYCMRQTPTSKPLLLFLPLRRTSQAGSESRSADVSTAVRRWGSNARKTAARVS